MRYSKSMIEAVQQVGLYEMMDYAIVDGDNKIIGLYKGNMAKKQAQMNMKGAERQVGIKKPLKIMPVSNKKKGDTVIGIGELTDKERGEIEEDVKNALAGFDNRIRDGGMDRKDFIKAKELYKRKDVKRLRQHIYSLDTSPLEVVMNLISIQDRPFFDKMYPNTRGGEFLARIAYQHRHLDENIDENKDDEKKRMKGAKLRLKMGDALDERMEKSIDKLPRQFLNPSKEVMVIKKNKVIVIDKKDQDKYTKQGWELAEVLDKEDEPKVKQIVKKLKKASDAHAGQAKDLEKAVNETVVTSKDLLDNKFKEEKNGAQHFSKVNEDNYIWNFVYDDFGRTKLTTEPDKATHFVYTMEGKDNPQLLKLSEKEILDYKKGETHEVSKK